MQHNRPLCSRRTVFSFHGVWYKRCMDDLASKKCTACEGGTPPLTEQEIKALSARVGGWRVVDNKKIQRKFTFRDFKGAMAFVHSVADIAETEGHHPDIHIFYTTVLIDLWTHAVGGLSKNDFIVAAKINALF